MVTRKNSTTLNPEQLKEINELASEGEFDVAGWNEMLNDALAQTGGPLTDEERDWADAVIAGSIPKTRPSTF
jgi:hypothetical protein